MSFKEQLDTDLKEAQKSRDSIRMNTIRMLKTVIKNREVEKKGELTDQELLQAVNSQVKARKEAIEEYTKAGRDELADKEQSELKILEAYLPEQLSSEELDTLVDNAIAETGAAGPKDMGAVMKALMPHVTGRADGKTVSQKVKERLAQL